VGRVAGGHTGARRYAGEVAGDDDDLDVLAPTPIDRIRRWLGPPRRYRLTRTVLLRLLGLVYLFAFIGLILQVVPLLGSHGLSPMDRVFEEMRARGMGFVDWPSLLWISHSDGALVTWAWIGLVLSLIVVAGYANAPVVFALWAIYGSFVRFGGLWFSFGWEIQLLETGFLAGFLVPALDPRPLAARPPPLVTIVLYRWLIVRIMLGAGLIKIRGDACWAELTCLDWHFETQPLPNPLSPWFHRLPELVHAGGVVFNHVVELAAPWFAFGPRPLRLVAGVLMAALQVVLIVSGNLSFLNWLTLVPIIACFDDDALLRLVPRRPRGWLEARLAAADAAGRDRPRRAAAVAAGIFAAIVAILSLEVVANLLSPHQHMNDSYERLQLVNTYGAFGSIGEVRNELIIEGTRDETPDEHTTWLAYELPCKPGALDRRPCVLGPYHYRLDWLIWFAAMEPEAGGAPWVVHLVWKLLHADRGARRLLAVDPFGDAPPRWIRVRRFVYHFAPADADAWWVRSGEEEWLPPVSIDTPELQEFLANFGGPSPIEH